MFEPRTYLAARSAMVLLYHQGRVVTTARFLTAVTWGCTNGKLIKRRSGRLVILGPKAELGRERHWPQAASPTSVLWSVAAQKIPVRKLEERGSGCCRISAQSDLRLRWP
jgi:hypothetical protein